ncbi:MAG TPA: hypothetical protein VGK02_12360 [Candidatus Aquicultor sp.]|jgi:hypothetical protein
MSTLIEELRTEHLDLTLSFEHLKNINVESEEGHTELRSVKSALLAHLRKENEELYPRLRDIAFNNLSLQRTLDWFTRDIAKISAVLILFLDTYCQGGSHLTYRRDYNRLNTILTALIEQEEKIVYNEFLQGTDENAA